MSLGDAFEGGEKAKAFKDLGLSVNELANASNVERFLMVGDAIGKLGDKADQVKAANDLMGKGSFDALSLIIDGTHGYEAAMERLKASGKYLTDADIEQIKQAHEGLIDLQDASEGFWRSLTVELAPGIKEVTDAINTLAPAVRNGMHELIEFEKHDWHASFADAAKFFLNPVGFIAGHAGGAASAFFGGVGSLERSGGESGGKKKSGDGAPDADEDDKGMADIERQMKEAQRIIEQSNPYAKYHREVKELTDNQFLTAGELGDALADAAKRYQDEMDRRDPFKKMAEEAKKLADENATNLERYQDNMKTIKEMHDRGFLDDKQFARAKEHDAHKYLQAEGLGDLRTPFDKFRESAESIDQAMQLGLLNGGQSDQALGTAIDKLMSEQGLDSLDKQHSRESHDNAAAALDVNTVEGFAQLQRALNPQTDQNAQKQLDLQQKSLDVENRIASILKSIDEKHIPTVRIRNGATADGPRSSQGTPRHRSRHGRGQCASGLWCARRGDRRFAEFAGRGHGRDADRRRRLTRVHLQEGRKRRADFLGALPAGRITRRCKLTHKKARALLGGIAPGQMDQQRDESYIAGEIFGALNGAILATKETGGSVEMEIRLVAGRAVQHSFRNAATGELISSVLHRPDGTRDTVT